jgi:hypothetical protein
MVQTSAPLRTRSLPNRNLDSSDVYLAGESSGDLLFVRRFEEQLQRFYEVVPCFFDRFTLARDVELRTQANETISLPLKITAVSCRFRFIDLCSGCEFQHLDSQQEITEAIYQHSDMNAPGTLRGCWGRFDLRHLQHASGAAAVHASVSSSVSPYLCESPSFPSAAAIRLCCSASRSCACRPRAKRRACRQRCAAPRHAACPARLPPGCGSPRPRSRSRASP